MYHPKISISVRENKSLSFCAYTASIPPSLSSDQNSALDVFSVFWNEAILGGETEVYIQEKVAPALGQVLLEEMNQEQFFPYGGDQITEFINRNNEVLKMCLVSIYKNEFYKYSDGILIDCGVDSQGKKFIQISLGSVSSSVFFQ